MSEVLDQFYSYYFYHLIMLTDEQQFQACMNRIRNQLNNLTVPQNPPKPIIRKVQTFVQEVQQEVKQEVKASLNISNSQTRYQLRHGQPFLPLLDPRDQVLEHEFNIDQPFTRQDLGGEGVPFTQCKLYLDILGKAKLFLVESISNVISIAFRYMCKKDLEQLEAKEYASKNIMLNVHSIYKQIISALQDNHSFGKSIDMEEVRSHLIIEIDNILNNILVNLADSYPQAPISGGTPRMREVINDVNRSEDPQNNFIFRSGLKIKNYLTVRKEKNELGQDIEIVELSESGDYTSFIMEVINSAIEVTQISKGDSRRRTVAQIFTQFNQYLFWVTGQKQYQQQLDSLDSYDQEEEGKKVSPEEIKAKKDNICKLFEGIFQNTEKKLYRFKRSQTSDLNKLWENAPEGIQVLKKDNKYALGQKIPSAVKSFSVQEVKNKQFTARHSSILRILTKWAESLQRIFFDSQKLLKERLYPFLNLDNELVNLRTYDNQGDFKLNRQLEEQYKEVRAKFNLVLNNSYGFIGKLLASDQQSVISSINRYTQTRAVSSKINAVLTSLVLSYTNILIHHLIKAGQNIRTERGYQDINLVTFGLGDLLRSKYMCSENTFINILKTMYMLDSKQSMQSKFKLVRVKNKLDDSANNIIVNYVFMGRLQCELQLSIQEAKGKESHYYNFSHFVYELTRSKFGAIAQCAIMISQLDPMIAACKTGYYKEKVDKIPIIRQRDMAKESNKEEGGSAIKQAPENKKQSSIKTAFFQCSSCNLLITNQNLTKFLEDPDLKICYNCVIKRYNCEDFLKKQLREALQKVSRLRIRSYRTLRSLRQPKFVATLNSIGEVDLYIAFHILKEFKTYLMKVDLKALQAIENQQEVEYESLEVLDITNEIKTSLKKVNPPKVLSYVFSETTYIPDELLTLMGFKKQNLETNIKTLLSNFKEYKSESSIIKSIKYKTQIIRANDQDGRVLDKVCRVLVLGEGKKRSADKASMDEVQNGQVLTLKYNKEKQLSMANVLKIQAERVGFSEIPKWIIQCTALKKLDLDQNNIRVVRRQDLPDSLQQLSLKRNNLQQLDVSHLTCLAFLYVKKNNLKKLSLSQENKLKQLSIKENPLSELEYLPTTLAKLWIDKAVAVKYDFKDMRELKFIGLANGRAQRQELVNLEKEVKIDYDRSKR